jgi:hypothetical protein
MRAREAHRGSYGWSVESPPMFCCGALPSGELMTFAARTFEQAEQEASRFGLMHRSVQCTLFRWDNARGRFERHQRVELAW